MNDSATVPDGRSEPAVRLAVGAVVIGRNEGERLRRCLESLVAQAVAIVYVDSGSTDGSLNTARSLGTGAVELDMSTPFCAARARNAGYQHLVETHPHVRHVQFVDGDCEIVAGWLQAGIELLDRQSDVAIAAGWLNEKAPEVSVYNRLGDVEWNFAGAGEVESVGGVFMIRRAAFDSVGGFDPTIAAGEEPELCQRLTRKGWRLVRLGQRMALHDLAMTRFSQWWRRQVRYGYGSADVAKRFGWPRFRRNNIRTRVWSAWLVGACIAAGAVLAGVRFDASFALLAAAIASAWPIQWARIAIRTWRRGQPAGLAAAYSLFLMLSYWPQMLGQLLYWNDCLRQREFRLIEHKGG